MSFIKRLFAVMMIVLLGQVIGAQNTTQDKELGSPGERRRNLPARVGPNVLKGHDLAEERQQWALDWYGPTSFKYLDAINEIAVKEVSKYRSKVPVPVFSGSSATLTYPLLGGVIGPLGGGTWVNIGPFGNLIDSTWPDHDTGRVTRIVPHPNWPTTPTLYVSFAGGVFSNARMQTPLQRRRVGLGFLLRTAFPPLVLMEIKLSGLWPSIPIMATYSTWVREILLMARDVAFTNL